MNEEDAPHESVGVHQAAGTPSWLADLAEVARSVRGPQLSNFLPPKGAGSRPASVLMLFADQAEGPAVLLVERAHDMRSHAGQVAFPGGAEDSGDTGPVAAALREAEEETGVDPDGIEVVDSLPTLWLPVSDYAVTPVLAWWRRLSSVYVVDPAETASVHVVALAEMLDPANRVTVRHPSGHQGPAFLVHDLIVWGFTAGLLSRVLALAGWERPWDETRVQDLPPDVVAKSLRDHPTNAS